MRGGQWPHKERTRTSPFYWLGVLLSADHHDKVATLLSHTNTYEAKHSYRKQDKQIAGAAGGGKRHLSFTRYISLFLEKTPQSTQERTLTLVISTSNIFKNLRIVLLL